MSANSDQELIGMKSEEAIRILSGLGIPVRMMAVNGMEFGMARDDNPRRRNLIVKDDIVVDVMRG